MVWIAGRAGYKDAQTRWNQTARDPVDFILLQWASTRPAKYTVVVVVRHSVSPFNRSPNAGESICQEALWFKAGDGNLGIHAHVRIACRASQSAAGVRKGSLACRDLIDFVCCKLASTHPVEHAAIVVVRHRFLLSFSGSFSQRSWAKIQSVETETCLESVQN
jgi:hypothetical protein